MWYCQVFVFQTCLMLWDLQVQICFHEVFINRINYVTVLLRLNPLGQRKLLIVISLSRMLCFGRVCASPCALSVSAALQGACNCSCSMLRGGNVTVILYCLGFHIFRLFHARNCKFYCVNLMLWSEVFMNSSNCTIYCTA